MPDWSYRTVFRPLLFRLPDALGRDLALAAIGGLGGLPGGRRVIEWMGHMRPPAALAARIGDTPVDTPVGLAAGIDPHLVGLPGLCRLGFGFVEVGPVSVEPRAAGGVRRDDAAESIHLDGADANPGLAATAARLDRLASPRPAIVVRLPARATADEDRRVIDRLRPHAAAIALPFGGDPHVPLEPRLSAAVAAAAGIPVLLSVPVHRGAEAAAAWNAAAAAGAAGVIVGRAEESDTATLGGTLVAAAEAAARRLRAVLGPVPQLVVAAGIHAPGDAERMVEAGADLVAIDSGLVFTGPGLAKRVNELLLRRCPTTDATPRVAADGAPPVAREAWPWTLLLGVSMFVGGVMALVIACTRVVMPYDEAMSGLTRERIAAVGPRLLPFMTHDRVSLSGAMLGVGILFAGLAWWGVRRGHHWAGRAVLVPAGVGFLSFFSFLGFGYFDPLHAFVSAILFQFMLLAIIGRTGPVLPEGVPDRANDPAWQRAQWGQLGWVVHGAGVFVAGIVISLVGMTTVFVAEDLAFLELCAADLAAVPGLVPLVAHDRGTFGGMLMVAGLTMLLASLWGFRRGAAWLWWTMLSAGTVAYAVAIAVHHAVGYVDPMHLAPAWGGLCLLWLAGIASRAYLCARPLLTT